VRESRCFLPFVLTWRGQLLPVFVSLLPVSTWFACNGEEGEAVWIGKRGVRGKERKGGGGINTFPHFLTPSFVF
jgi:hypothetical protein